MLSLFLIAGAIDPNVFAASYCQMRLYGISSDTARSVAVDYAYRDDLPEPGTVDGFRRDAVEAVDAIERLCPQI